MNQKLRSYDGVTIEIDFGSFSWRFCVATKQMGSRQEKKKIQIQIPLPTRIYSFHPVAHHSSISEEIFRCHSYHYGFPFYN